MSFADIRRLIAILNEMRYPGSRSMDSFRYPNFELVADCLHWMLLRYDPTVDLDIDISSDGRRMSFLKQVTEIMLCGARIKLNPRRLYLADGYAINELLKVASLLQKATNISTTHEFETFELDSSIKAFDVKAARLLVHKTMTCGAFLCAQLDVEPNLQESRSRVTMTNTNMDEINQGLSEAISTMLESISSAQQAQVDAQKEEEVFQVKLEKQQIELERNKERLDTLNNVRPAYVDKYEALQKDLDKLFIIYSKKSCNLQWLQSQMEGHDQEEQKLFDEANCCMRQLQRQLYEEELSILCGEEEVDGSVAKPRCSEESDGEGTTYRKSFHGNSLETIVDPRAKSHQLPSRYNKTESSRGLPKGPMQITSHAKSGLKALANPQLTPELKSEGSCILTCTNDAVRVEEGFKPGASDSEPAIDGSDITGVLEEADDIPLDTDGIDPKDTGENNSSDDDF